MYLYLGQDTVINTKNMIGIFDLDNTTTSGITKDFLGKAEKNKQVIPVSWELPKSFVLCKDKRGTRVYLSQISSATLKKRAYNRTSMQE